jgi:hypothetical protein
MALLMSMSGVRLNSNCKCFVYLQMALQVGEGWRIGEVTWPTWPTSRTESLWTTTSSSDKSSLSATDSVICGQSVPPRCHHEKELCHTCSQKLSLSVKNVPYSLNLKCPIRIFRDSLTRYWITFYVCETKSILFCWLLIVFTFIIYETFKN